MHYVEKITLLNRKINEIILPKHLAVSTKFSTFAPKERKLWVRKRNW